jgi:hypothetical protein
MQFRGNYPLGTRFAANTIITKFNELVYFTGITGIPDGGLGNCTSLVELTLPSNIRTIGGYGIRNTRLTELVIPANVTSMGSQALAANNYLTKVTMLGTTPPSTNANNFADNFRYFYVPSSALNTYKAASVWSSHTNNILPIPE